MTEPLFPLGQLVVTPGVIAALSTPSVAQTLNVQPLDLIARHQSGDWGDLPVDDKLLNNYAVESGEGMLLSEYQLTTDLRVWVITEADRSVTTVLLPSEY